MHYYSGEQTAGTSGNWQSRLLNRIKIICTLSGHFIRSTFLTLIHSLEADGVVHPQILFFL